MSSNPKKRYKYIRQYVVSHIVGEIKVGDRFHKKDWPEHITLFPWVECRDYEAMAGFMYAVDRMDEFPVYTGGLALGEVVLFGDDQNVPVREVHDSTPLGVMHGVLMATLGQYVVDPQYSGGLYRPHVTVEQGDPGEGAQLVVDSLCMVLKQVHGYRRVVAAERLTRQAVQ